MRFGRLLKRPVFDASGQPCIAFVILINFKEEYVFSSRCCVQKPVTEMFACSQCMKGAPMQKKIFPLILCLLSSSALSAEVIESVSFNPSRFGQYERLTVSEEADLKGGLSTTNLNVTSAGVVSMTVSKPLGDTTAFYVPTVDAVEGNGVSLTNACFSGSGADCRNYDASSATLPNTADQPLVISSLSGEGSFERDSFMNRVTTALDTLKIKAGQIDLATLTVYGGDAETYSNSLLKGLKLAGNDIPKPVYGYTTDKNGGQAGALSSCTLDWESRNTVQKDGKYDTYKVLVLKNCSTGPSSSCTMKHETIGGGQYTYSQISANDTCNGTPSTFTGTLEKGSSCVDYIQTGSTVGNTVEGTWDSYRGTYSLLNSHPQYSTLKNGGQYSNCLYTVQNKVWGSGTYDWYGNDKATELCKLQCPNMSHGEGGCNTNPCQFIWGCTTTNYGGSWECAFHQLRCTTDSTVKYPVTIYRWSCV